MGSYWNMHITDRAVVRAIAQLDGPCSQEELAELIGCSRHTVLRSIRRLKGIVTPVGSGNGAPYTYQINYDKLPESLRKEIAPTTRGNNGH